MNKYNYPIGVAKDISEKRNIIRRYLVENSDLIKNIFREGVVAELRDTEMNNNYFIINTPRYQDGEVMYSIHFRPSDVYNPEPISIDIKGSALFEKLDFWLEMINDFRSLDFSEEEIFTREYQEEFASYIIVEDEEVADTKPFSHQKQLIWVEVIDATKEAINNSEAVTEEVKETLLAETEILKASITNKTQRAFVKSAAKMFAKIKTASTSLLKETGTEIKKRVIKEGIDLGLKIITEGPAFLEKIIHQIHSSGQ